MIETFEQVKLQGIFRWKEAGKPKQKTVTFSQTLNPLNKLSTGKPKSRNDILKELREEQIRWYRACEKAKRGLEPSEV